MKKIVDFFINTNLLVVNWALSIFDKIYQKKIIKKLRELLDRKIDMFFDVGAHKGEFTNLILQNFSINSLELFEPNPDSFKYLKNKIDNKRININNYALGEKEERKKFKIMRETSSSTLSEINKNSKYFKRKNFILNLGLSSEIFEEIDINILDGLKITKEKKIGIIDLLKIDTEGHEYFVLKGFQENISKIKVIFFEHHYDQMIIKNYTFSDIHEYLKSKNFTQNSKFKMPFRKSFEYIYTNKNYF